MSYLKTFITVSPSSLLDTSEIPISKRANKPIHIIQYELLAENPYRFNHYELVFEVYLIKEGIQIKSDKTKIELWKQLFSKGHPCLRASALIKRYGFGAHYNVDGKIALYPNESDQYQNFVNNDAVKKLTGMKFKK